MADAAVSFLLVNLKELALRHYSLISDAEGNLNKLQNDLERIMALLEDAASHKSKGRSFKTWEKQIRDVVYNIEDVIDSYVTHAAGKRSGIRKYLTSQGLDLAEKVKNIREEEVTPVFDKAIADFASLPTSDKSDQQARRTIDRIRQIEPMVVDKTIVGFEDSIAELIGNLKEESSELEAISIVGMPGLGKTTVASKIYHDTSLDYEFPTRIWVNVSEDHNRKNIYLTILKKFSPLDMSNESEIDLAKRVREHLEHIKFLLVVDDVWTVDAWKDIKLILPMNKGSCKVLITSRHNEVASAANPRRNPHRLRFLNKDESWKLLQLEVYGKEGVWPQRMEETGKKIACDCHGLPLALVVIGGILLNRLSTADGTNNDWISVSLTVEDMMKQDKDKIMESIIALSYEKLPYNLRDCFLYLGVFPEDHEISIWKLKRLWIAEGFVKEEYGAELSLEEIAEENLKELIKRNLVMVGRKNSRGELKTCRVHDVIREFCKKEGGEDQNFLQEIRMLVRHGKFKPPISVISKFRRLCIYSHVLEMFQEKPKGEHVRSFLSFSKEGVDVPLDSFSPILDAFELLRVFEGSCMKFPKFPSKITQLIHLRYLTLAAGETFKVIPEAVGKLWNLQTFVITASSPSFEIKVDLSNMERLRHLKTKAAIVLTKDKKGVPNKNLQTLTRLSTVSCKEEVFSKVPNLKILGIHGQLEDLLKNTGLQTLVCLVKLTMIYDSGASKSLSQLPASNSFPPNLKSLTLSSTKLEWKHMDTLGMLLKLEFLKLKEIAFRGDRWEDNGKGFLSLRCLHIERSDLVTWEISKGAFPKLGSLVLKNCEKLRVIPVGLAKNLHTLEIERVTSDAVRCAQDIQRAKQSAGDVFKLVIAPGDSQTKGSEENPRV